MPPHLPRRFPSTTDRPSLTPLRLLAGVAPALVAIALLYRPTLHFGFFWDDYEVLRPWHWQDWLSTWVGPYRPWNDGAPFYRPLTATYYAVLTRLVGDNAWLMHAVIPVLILTLATLTYVWIRRELDSAVAATAGALAMVIQPSLVSATGPWIANQYHTMQLILLSVLLLLWQRCRADRSWRRWWALAVPCVAAAWLKEGGIMLPLALVTAHALSARLSSNIPPPPRAVVIGAVLLTLALVAWRAWWLPTSFGYGARSPWASLLNLQRAWRQVFLVSTATGALKPAMTLAKWTVLGGAAWLLWRSRHTASARLVVIGGSAAFFANLPLLMVSSPGRWHIVSWGAAVAATAVIAQLIARHRWVGGAVAIGMLTVFAIGAQQRIERFAPCSPGSQMHLQDMIDDQPDNPVLPARLVTWMRGRLAACQAGLRPVDTPPLKEWYAEWYAEAEAARPGPG